MAVPLSNTYIEAKNQLSSSNVWIWLIELEVNKELIVRITNNNENVTYNGNSFTAYPFTIDNRNEDSEARINNINIRVGNANRVLNPYIRQYDGFVGSKVRLVHGTYDLINNHNQIAFLETYEIITTTSSNGFINFVVGIPTITKKKFPSQVYYKNFCPYTYGGIACSGGNVNIKYTASIGYPVIFYANEKRMYAFRILDFLPNIKEGSKLIITNTTNNNKTLTVSSIVGTANIYFVEDVEDETISSGYVNFSIAWIAQLTGVSNISFIASSKTINKTDISSAFPDLEIGDKLKVVDTEDNNGVYTITNIATNALTVSETIVDESNTSAIISYSECNKTFPDCVKRKNENRYGGWPSIPFGAIIKVTTNA